MTGPRDGGPRHGLCEAGAVPDQPSRRSVLTGSVGLLGLTACSGPALRPRPATIDPDLALTAAAVARERALLAAYDAAATATPDAAARLAPLRADHVAHLAALGAPITTAVTTAVTTAASIRHRLSGASAGRRDHVLRSDRLCRKQMRRAMR